MINGIFFHHSLIDVVNTLGNNEFDKKIDVEESKEPIQEDSTQNTESYSFAGTLILQIDEFF